MIDRQAFLRRICREPWDDYPRMVYADYLDECGERERAELIRVQCELPHTTQFDQKTLGNIGGGPDKQWEWYCCTGCKGAVLSRGGLDVKGVKLCRYHELENLSETLLTTHGEQWAYEELVRPAGIPVGGDRAWLSHEGVEDKNRVVIYHATGDMVRSVTRDGHHITGDRNDPASWRQWVWWFGWRRGFIEELTCSFPLWDHYPGILQAEMALLGTTPPKLPTPIMDVHLTTWPNEVITTTDAVSRGHTHNAAYADRITRFTFRRHELWEVAACSPASTPRRGLPPDIRHGSYERWWQKVVGDCLTAHWPGIRFHLPPYEVARRATGVSYTGEQII